VLIIDDIGRRLINKRLLKNMMIVKKTERSKTNWLDQIDDKTRTASITLRASHYTKSSAPSTVIGASWNTFIGVGPFDHLHIVGRLVFLYAIESLHIERVPHSLRVVELGEYVK
jgi:hypothetical protein